MNPTVRVLCGALLGAVGCATALAAQTGQGVAVNDLLNVVGVGTGMGALVAWGTQKEKVAGHDLRIKKLEDDRVTRPEFEAMGGTIRNIEHDLRQVREMLERRTHARD